MVICAAVYAMHYYKVTLLYATMMWVGQIVCIMAFCMCNTCVKPESSETIVNHITTDIAAAASPARRTSNTPTSLDSVAPKSVSRSLAMCKYAACVPTVYAALNVMMSHSSIVTNNNKNDDVDDAKQHNCMFIPTQRRSMHGLFLHTHHIHIHRRYVYPYVSVARIYGIHCIYMHPVRVTPYARILHTVTMLKKHPGCTVIVKRKQQ